MFFNLRVLIGLCVLSCVLVINVNADHCDQYTCNPSRICNEVGPCDEPNQRIVKGDYCRCCDVCITIGGLNEMCNDDFFISKGDQHCQHPLVCIDEFCSKGYEYEREDEEE